MTDCAICGKSMHRALAAAFVEAEGRRLSFCESCWRGLMERLADMRTVARGHSRSTGRYDWDWERADG